MLSKSGADPWGPLVRGWPPGQPSEPRCVRLCSLLFISVSLFAQPNAQPPAEWIRSPEPLKQAWGARHRWSKAHRLIPDQRVVDLPMLQPMPTPPDSPLSML